MNKFTTRIIGIFFSLLFPILLFSQISIQTDRATARYEAAERMNFVVEVQGPGTIDYVIRFDQRTSAITSGKIEASTAGRYEIPFCLEEPGFVICSVFQNGVAANVAATFSPFDIPAYMPEPTDFDDFWNQAKAELAGIPMGTQISAHSSTQYSTTYRINLAQINNRRVYGYISIPVGAGPFPAILTLPSFGATAGHVRPRPFIAEQANAISMAISIHNAEPDQVDPNSYMPNDITNRDQIYYKQALLGAVRAIDYIFSRPDFDGESLGVVGVSQGGGLAICTAGLDQRVKLLVTSIAALGQQNGLIYDRPSGHPYYLFTAGFEPSISVEATSKAIRYFDAAYFSRRYKGPVQAFVGYLDQTCPPATIMAALNQLQGPKIIQHALDKGHDVPDYFTERFDFIRSHFAATKTPPSPFVEELKTSYEIDAGADQTAAANTAITLNASIRLNGVKLDGLPVQWDKVSGPGKVQFSQAYALDSTVQFSRAGSYTLSFSVEDTRFLDTANKCYTIVDYITIEVD